MCYQYVCKVIEWKCVCYKYVLGGRDVYVASMCVRWSEVCMLQVCVLGGQRCVCLMLPVCVLGGRDVYVSCYQYVC